MKLREDTKNWFMLLFAFGVGALLALLVLTATAAPARADHGDGRPYVLTVDGIEYEGTVSGQSHTVHFETPDTNPVEASTARNTWTGNGSENLPCEGGIHWIDNNNRLTVSNCLPDPTTTTTSIPETTTTTVAETTTTTEPPSGSTTTTVISETTSTSIGTEPTTTFESDTPTTECPTEDRSARGYCPEDEPDHPDDLGLVPLPRLIPSPDTTTTTTPSLPGEPTELPFTGPNVPLLVVLGLALLASGGYAVRRGALSDS